MKVHSLYASRTKKKSYSTQWCYSLNEEQKNVHFQYFDFVIVNNNVKSFSILSLFFHSYSLAPVNKQTGLLHSHFSKYNQKHTKQSTKKKKNFIEKHFKSYFSEKHFGCSMFRENVGHKRKVSNFYALFWSIEYEFFRNARCVYSNFYRKKPTRIHWIQWKWSYHRQLIGWLN